MLSELHIKNFAIIDQLELSFQSGLVIFSGETGAGKSIIIDAVETVLGGRADSSMVRTGAPFAIIEGIFTLPQASFDSIATILEDEGLSDQTEFLTLSREIRPNGRNIARVNGRSTTVGLLRQLGEFLIDIHGQSEHLSLLKVNQHIELLDRYASSTSDNQLQEQLALYKEKYRQHQEVRQELAEIRQSERDAARLTDLLNYQIKEIEAARLNEGEDQELLEERNRLSNAEELALATQKALIALDEGTPDSPAMTDLLGQVLELLSGLAKLDSTQLSVFEQIQSLFDNTTELVSQLRSYQEKIEFNPKRLDQVEARLSMIENLKKKYGSNIQAILQFVQKAELQLDEITHVEEKLEELETRQSELLIQLGKLGESLSKIRHQAANILEKDLEAQLSDLRMSGARLKVQFSQKGDPQGVPLENGDKVAFNASGLEQVEFLIETNPGEGYKPLVKIASGGETSRLMLGLKYVLAQADYVPTLIFDEIDQGIGGRAGGIVGQKLWQLSHKHQVLCVTHLPQLAAYGKQHYHVGKEVLSGRTITQVNQLHGNERLLELASMIGTVSDGTLKSAQELVDAVQQYKDKNSVFVQNHQ